MNKLLEQLWSSATSPRASRWITPLVGGWLGWLAWMRFLHLPDEGRYVGVAWDMYRADSFWVPLMNGLPYFHKPPLFYWLNELSFLLFGVHEWSARITPWLAAWSSAMALYFFLRKRQGVELATASLGILVTMPLFYGGAQYANLDMLVAGMMTLTVLAGAEAVLRSESDEAYRLMSIWAGVFAALAILAKGLIGIVLPGGVLFFWLIFTGRWRKFGVLLWPPVILAFALVVLPWFIAMQKLYPDFFDYFFIHQHVERFVSESFNNTQPFWFYLPLLFSLTLPWSLATPVFFYPGFWQKGDRSFLALTGIWFGVMTVFFSIPASKLIGYILPALAPLAVLLAQGILYLFKNAPNNWLKHLLRTAKTCFVISVFVCVTTLIIFRFNQKDSGSEMGRLIARELQADDTFVFLRSYPFDLPIYSGMRKPAWVVENWPGIIKRDNWRNELADAARFNPGLGKEVLVNLDALLPRMCQTDNRVFWLRGDENELPAWPFLQGLAPVRREDNESMLWKIKTDSAFKNKFCSSASSGE
jgi:4-amino-4-deoxy-L-arabinose transferase-like glycosyltransferase